MFVRLWVDACLRLSIVLAGVVGACSAWAEQPACPAWLNHSLKQLHGAKQIDICETTAGQTVLLVNTASHCGFTPQFKGLEALYQRYKDDGLVIIGFPSDDFKQEAATEEETAKVCFYNFGVTFLMTEPVKVTGDDAHPIFKHLATEAGAPKWNFYKYLVAPSGEVVDYYVSLTKPESGKIRRAIDKLVTTSP